MNNTKTKSALRLLFLVGSSGLEPPTSRLSGVRSNHLSYEPLFGGDERDRTDDPLLAKQVLSQLSYTPIFGFAPQKLNNDVSFLNSFHGPQGPSKLNND